jgi:hypothetical protein
MSFNDLLSLIIAILVFVIALLTFVYTIFTGPRLHMLIGQEIKLVYTRDKRLSIEADFAFFNGGAQPGALVELSGTISNTNSSKRATLRWERFLETRNIAEPGKATHFFVTAVSPAHPLIVPGRAAGTGGVEMGIRLYTDKLFILESGESYILELRGLEGPKLTRWCKASGKLEISQDNVDYLVQYGTMDETDRYQMGLILQRNPLSKRSLVSGLLQKPAIPDFIPRAGQRPQPATASPVKPSAPQI